MGRGADRPRAAGPQAAAAARHPAHAGSARPGGRLRRVELSAGLLGGGRRHGLRARGRLPGRRQGAPRAPRHLGARRAAAIRTAARETRHARGRLRAWSRGPRPRSASRSSRIPPSAPSASPGSLAAGRTLFDAAALRPEPIPVYAEMGSSNPVFLLPGALAERGEAIAKGLAASVTLGAGQFCTNPGLALRDRLARGERASLKQTGDLLAATTAGHDGPRRHQGRLRPRARATWPRIAGRARSARARAGAGPHPETEAPAALLLTDAPSVLGQPAAGRRDLRAGGARRALRLATRDAPARARAARAT